jgi:hypothetical protein
MAQEKKGGENIKQLTFDRVTFCQIEAKNQKHMNQLNRKKFKLTFLRVTRQLA